MAKATENPEGEVTALLESGSRVLGLRLCLYSFIPGFRAPQEWRIHFTPCCEAVKQSDRNHARCVAFDLRAASRELETLRGGRLQTCPFGFSELVAPVYSEGLYAGLLFAGQIWLKRGAPPAGVAAVRPEKAWLEDRRQTLLALAARIGTLMRGEQSYLPATRREAILSWMNGMLEKPARVEDLAASLKVSPAHAGRLVKRLFGLSFPEFARGMKMRDACRYLLSCDLPVGEIAGFVGYADQNHFSRVFKRHVGLSPLAYRKAHAGGA